MNVLLGIFSFILVLTSVFMVLIILAQRAKTDGGMGAALGGGMAEAAFGGESANVLQKVTTWAAVTFFVLSFGLYLGYLALARNAAEEAGEGLPSTPGLIQTPDEETGVTPGAQEAAESALDAMDDADGEPSINFDLPPVTEQTDEAAEPPANESPSAEGDTAEAPATENP